MNHIPNNAPLKRSFAWYLAGMFVYALCQWAIIIILTKFTSLTDVGHYALALAINAPLTLLSRLHLRTILATDIKGTYRFEEYLRFRLLTISATIIMLLIPLPMMQFDHETILMILLITAARAFESVSDIYYGLLQKYEKLRLISISMILRSTGSLALFALILITRGQILAGILAYTIVWALTLLFYDIPVSRRLLARNEPRGDKDQTESIDHKSLALLLNPASMRGLLIVAAPLGVSLTTYSLSTNIPKYFLEAYHGSDSLGLFAAMAYLILAGGLVVNALGQTTMPRLATHFANGDTQKFNLLLMKILIAGLGLGLSAVLVVSLFGEEVLRTLYSAEYALHADIFVWVILAGALGWFASLLGYGIAATRQFIRLSVPYFGLGVVATISSMALIPPYGMRGAAWALCVVNTTAVVGLLYVLLTTKAAQPLAFSEVDPR